MTYNLTFQFLPFSYGSYVKCLSVIWFDLETIKERKKRKPNLAHIGHKFAIGKCHTQKSPVSKSCWTWVALHWSNCAHSKLSGLEQTEHNCDVIHLLQTTQINHHHSVFKIEVFNALQMRFGFSKYSSLKATLQYATPNWKWRHYLKSSIYSVHHKNRQA